MMESRLPTSRQTIAVNLPAPHGDWDADATAMYERHPAYAHLTFEQRLEMQRVVDEEGEERC